jgi:hypothetical protein
MSKNETASGTASKTAPDALLQREPQSADRDNSLSNADAGDNPVSAPAFLEFHRALRPMRRTVEGMFDNGRYEQAFPLLHAVILLDSKPSFLRGSIHPHFPKRPDCEGGGHE